MALNEEITKHRSEIFSEGYSMSIGELISLYENEEIDVHPEFQRIYRWSENQKSRLIESLLLGIPIPSIFVSQRPDGVWDVIDGLQRLSTLFELVGILKNEKDKTLKPLVMTKTKYLPSLDGRTWDDSKGTGIGRDNQLLIKRSKIDVKIILRESSEASKYELFQRLNTGGSQLSDQELRNAIMIMVNPEFYRWFAKLGKDDDFQTCIALSDRASDEQFDLELVMRFLVLRNLDGSQLRGIGELGEFLTEQAVKFAEDSQYDYKTEERHFKATFKLLAAQLGDKSFRRFDAEKQQYMGGFLISAFEFLAIGLSQHLQNYERHSGDVDLDQIARAMWADKSFTGSIGSGIPASSRIPKVIPYAREFITTWLSALEAN
jgi:hypothetical protein